MDISDKKEYICDNVNCAINIIPHNKKLEICRVLKNKIPEHRLDEFCFESADGTRINLDDLERIENYEDIINEIYNIVYQELKK